MDASMYLYFGIFALCSSERLRRTPSFGMADLAQGCLEIHAITERNRFLWDELQLLVTYNASTLLRCRGPARLPCGDLAKGIVAEFDEPAARLKLGSATAARFYQLRAGWNLRRLGFGKKHYLAKSGLCR